MNVTFITFSLSLPKGKVKVLLTPLCDRAKSNATVRVRKSNTSRIKESEKSASMYHLNVDGNFDCSFMGRNKMTTYTTHSSIISSFPEKGQSPISQRTRAQKGQTK